MGDTVITAEQLRANQLAQAALRRGVLKRPKRCQWCRRAGVVVMHHDDHSKPLDVRWLCTTCHGKCHQRVVMRYHISPAVIRQCAKDGVSVRAQILKLLEEWVTMKRLLLLMLLAGLLSACNPITPTCTRVAGAGRTMCATETAVPRL